MLRILLNFLTILYLIDGRDSPLYHSTDELPKNAKLIKQLPLLEVPSDRSCDITACHLSTKDNKIHHLNCHIDNCDYGSYHCLHDGISIVHFCGKFNQCDERELPFFYKNTRITYTIPYHLCIHTNFVLFYLKTRDGKEYQK